MRGKTFISLLTALVLLFSCLNPSVGQLTANAAESLPTDFVSSTIGNEETSGGGSFSTTTKQFTVSGSGQQIGKDTGVTDSYQFINIKQSGNFSFTAKLVNYDSSNALYGQAGIFIREDNTTNNANYFGVYLEPSKNQFRYAFRDNSVNRTGAAAIAGFDSSSQDVYIKVVRNGNQFTYYMSADPSFPADQTVAKGQTVNMESNDVYVGFVVANGQLGKTSTATFEDVTIENNGTIVFDSEALVDPTTPDTEGLTGGFSKLDINQTVKTGNTTFESNTGAFTVTGSGTDIAKDDGIEDSYQFANYAITGDFSFTARLTDFTNANAPYSKAGMVVRENLTASDANYVGVIFDTAKDEVRYAYRDYTVTPHQVGASLFNTSVLGLPENLYVNITRTGNKFTYLISNDPTFPADATYTRTKSLKMAQEVYIGFAVANGANNTASATATFDNVTIKQNGTIVFDSMANAILPPTAPQNVAASEADEAVVLTWDSAENAANYIIKRSTEENGTYTEVATVTADTTSYLDTTVTLGATYYYKVAAVNELDEEAESAVAAITTSLPEQTTFTIDWSNGSGNAVTSLSPSMELTAQTELAADEDREITLVLALYDADNTMVQMVSTSAASSKTGTRTVQASFTLPSDTEGYTAKAFVLDSLENLCPLSDVSILQ